MWTERSFSLLTAHDLSQDYGRNWTKRLDSRLKRHFRLSSENIRKETLSLSLSLSLRLYQSLIPLMSWLELAKSRGALIDAISLMRYHQTIRFPKHAPLVRKLLLAKLLAA